VQGFHIRVAAQCDAVSQKMRKLVSQLRLNELDNYARLVERVADDAARLSMMAIREPGPRAEQVANLCSLQSRLLRELRDRLLEASLSTLAAWAEEGADVLGGLAAYASEQR